MINFFKIYDNAIPDVFCDEAISFFEEHGNLTEDGIVAGSKESYKKIKKVAKNTIELDLSSLLNNRGADEYQDIKKLHDIFNKHSIEYSSKYLYDDNYIEEGDHSNWNDIVEYLKSRDSLFSNRNVKIGNFLPDVEKIVTSGYRIKKYNKNSGYYNYHSDPAWAEVSLGENRWRVGEGEYLSNIRFLSVIMYLNTVDDGGETTFPLIPIKIKPVKGRVAVFPTHWTYLHKAEPPMSSDKYSMNTFVSIVV